MSYDFYDPRTDPARNKNRFFAGLPGTTKYPQQVNQFNRGLYVPRDTQPISGDLVRTSPNSYATPYGTASVRFITPTPPARPRPSFAGITVPQQTDNSTQQNEMGSDEGMIAQLPPPSANATIGPLGSAMDGNAMQRWGGNSGGLTPQQEYNGTASGMRQLSPQTQFFRTTRRIDAHAYPADPTQNEGAIPGTFDPGGRHMPSRPVTRPEGGYSWQPKVQQLAPEGSWSTYTPY